MFTALAKGAQVSMTSLQRTLHDAVETHRFAECLARSFHGGEVVLLTGEIGAGKTVLSRGIGAALGVPYWRGSPTFSLIHEYDSWPRLVHGDLYRLEAREVEELGLEEYAGHSTVLVIEWADRAAHYLASLPAERLVRINLEHGSGDRRLMTVHDSASVAAAQC